MTSIRRFLTRHALGSTTTGFAMASMLLLEGDGQTGAPSARLLRDGVEQKPQAPAAATATAGAERINVPFSDPSRPGRLSVNMHGGNIHVKGYDGQTVVVTTRPEGDEESRQSRVERGGLRRIPNTASGLTIEEEHNEMRISTSPHKDIVLEIQVPTRTALKLGLVNGDDIVVENVDADMEINNVNGDIRLTNVAGTGIVHSTNGDLTASFSRVSGKPMSFVTFNGDVNVSLPADLKATVRMDSGQGDVYTDFAVEMLPASASQTVQDDRSKGGKYRLKIERAMIGRINGGGVDYTFKTYNGDIHLRRYQAGAPAKE